MLERLLIVPAALAALLGFGAVWLTLRLVSRKWLRWTIAGPVLAASSLAALFFALALYGIWFPHGEYDIKSPSGRYLVSATVGTRNCQSCIRLALKDSAGQSLGFYDTNASNAMKWTVGWMQAADIVVLYSADVGSTAYTISARGKLIPLPETPEIRDRGEQLRKLRFPRSSDP